MRFVYSIIGIIFGLVFIKYRESIYRFTGKNAWAEKYLGQGGTINLYVLFGGAVVILSILYMTGTLGIFAEKTARRLLRFGS